MIYPVRTHYDIDSIRALEEYLEKLSLTLATNHEVPAKELLQLSMPNWNKKKQGCVILFVPLDITTEPDETSPAGKKIVVRLKTQPVISTFLAGMCCPLSLVTDDILPAGSIVWVKTRSIAQAA